MDEVIGFQTDSGGLLLLDPASGGLLGDNFGSFLGIVLDPEGRTAQGVGDDEPWAVTWERAAHPLRLLRQEGRFQVILTGEGVFHVRITDAKDRIGANVRGSWFCGRLLVNTGRLMIADMWPNPENSHDLAFPPPRVLAVGSPPGSAFRRAPHGRRARYCRLPGAGSRVVLRPSSGRAPRAIPSPHPVSRSGLAARAGLPVRSYGQAERGRCPAAEPSSNKAHPVWLCQNAHAEFLSSPRGPVHSRPHNQPSQRLLEGRMDHGTMTCERSSVRRTSIVNTEVIATELLAALDGNTTIEEITGRDPGFDTDAAYRVSAEILRRRRARGEKPIGRKVGFTNRTIWPEYGVFYRRASW